MHERWLICGCRYGVRLGAGGRPFPLEGGIRRHGRVCATFAATGRFLWWLHSKSSALSYDGGIVLVAVLGRCARGVCATKVNSRGRRSRDASTAEHESIEAPPCHPTWRQSGSTGVRQRAPRHCLAWSRHQDGRGSTVQVLVSRSAYVQRTRKMITLRNNSGASRSEYLFSSL